MCLTLFAEKINDVYCIHRRNEEGDQGGPGPPNKEQNWENKEQNGCKKFQNGAFLGYGNS